MPRKKIVCVGKCFICKTKHYAHLGGWVINGSGKLLCYEIDHEGQLRTDCFKRAMERNSEQEAQGNKSTSQEMDVGRREMESVGEGFRPQHASSNPTESTNKNNSTLETFTTMTKYDTETANIRQKDFSSSSLLRHFQKQKTIKTKKPRDAQANISLLKDVVKHTNINYVKAKEKGKKIGYINQQVDKKLLIASKNMSRDAWTKLAIQVSKMDDEQKKAWINAKI